MSLRATLAALDDGALEAAASKGLVRRAHRDHEAGLALVKRDTLDGAELTVDGETVALGSGGLAGASCTCPSQALCRHILAAVIALRGEARGAAAIEETARAAPYAGAVSAADAGPDSDPLAALVAVSAADLVKAFGRAALRDAEAILAAAGEGTDPIAVETVARACVIRLPGQPEVRYLADFGLTGMLSKAPAPLAVAGDAKAKRKSPSIKALHAAAVLAVRRRHAGESIVCPASADAPTDAAAAPAKAPNDSTFLDAVTDALAEAARAALATAPLLLEERLLDLALSSRADALPRLAGALRGIAEDLSERRARAAAFEPAAALAAIARTYALVLALRRAGDDPILRGAIRQPYAELGALDLVGCGLELWRTPTGARGATAHGLACQAAGGAGSPWYTVTLARAAGQDPFFVPRQAVRAEPVWGRSLETLAASRFHLEGARAADGRLSQGKETHLTMGEGGIAQLLEARPDLFVEDWTEIGARLAALFSPSLRTMVRTVPLLLRPVAVEPVQFDATQQRAWLPVRDRGGRWLDLTIAEDAEDTRLDAIVAMQANGVPRVLVALAARAGAEIVLSPIAALGRTSLESFDLYEPPRLGPAPRQTMLERLKGGLGALVAGRSSVAVFATVPRKEASTALVALAEDEALALAELGGRMEDPARLDKLARLAAQLEAAGLAPLAALLSQLATAPTRERPLRLLAFTHAAACHTALAPRLPLVHRVS